MTPANRRLNYLIALDQHRANLDHGSRLAQAEFDARQLELDRIKWRADAVGGTVIAFCLAALLILWMTF